MAAQTDVQVLQELTTDGSDKYVNFLNIMLQRVSVFFLHPKNRSNRYLERNSTRNRLQPIPSSVKWLEKCCRN